MKKIHFLAVLMTFIIATALRNLSVLYYVIIISLFAFLALNYKLKTKRICSSYQTLAVKFFFFGFVALSIWVCFWSGLYWQNLEFINGIPRILLVLCFTLLVLWGCYSEREIVYLLKIILFLYVMSALSIFYQVLFGPIDWFVEPAGRAGLVRYGSILGSLTIFGSVIGYALVLNSCQKVGPKSVFLSGLIFSVLSISAFVNISKSTVGLYMISILLISLFSLIWLRKSIFRRNLLSFLLIMIGLSIAIVNTPVLERHFNSSVISTFGFVDSYFDSADVIKDSPSLSSELILKRLFFWTTSMYQNYGDISIVFGVGLQGAGGVMGLDSFGMAHNAFGDLLFMGGITYLAIFMLLFFAVQLELIVFMRKSSIDRTFFMMNSLFFANLFFASGAVFHPAISIPFWLSVVHCVTRNRVMGSGK